MIFWQNFLHLFYLHIDPQMSVYEYSYCISEYILFEMFLSHTYFESML